MSESLLFVCSIMRYIVAVILTVLCAVIFAIISNWCRNTKTPSVGSAWSRLSPLTTVRQSRALLTEGYRRHPNAFFKMPLFPFGWTTVANGPKLIDELRNAPDDVFSFSGSSDKIFQTKYTLSPSISTLRYTVPIVRTTLTRNVGTLFPDMIDEMELAFLETLDLPTQGWKSVSALSTMMKVFCRITNRLVIGVPLCRDEEFHNINMTFTIDVIKAAFKINLFPTFLHPIVGPYFSKVNSYRRRILKLVESVTVERKRELVDFEHGGKSQYQPNDYLSWLIQNAPSGQEETVPYLAMRLLEVNFAALHTTTTIFTHALYHLAAQPQYANALREEVEYIIKEEGWTRAAMQKMRKIDSFLREAARINSITLTTLNRYCLRDYTFADGTTVRKGSFVAASLYSTHMDDSIYENASEFDPWRFSDIRSDAREGMKHQLTATGPEFLSFGYGKHACPGRFFAANELKAMLSYVVMNYDVKFRDEGVRPPNEYWGDSVAPNSTAEVLIRKRED